MRRGNSDKAFIVGDDGVFNGVALGWDFVAEHEWGIKKLSRDYGLREVSRDGRDVVGIEARRIQAIPETLKLITKGKGKDKVTYLISARYYSTADSIEDRSKKDLDRMVDASTYGDQDLQCAWDEGSFGVRVIGKENRKYLKELFAAFNNEDIIITRGSATPNNPFSGSGLMLLIASKLPQSYIDEQAEVDIDHLNLVEAAEKTGIAERLAAADKQYFALSPKWANDEKTEVIFWLNPMEQTLYNSGWYTVETLDEWIADKGNVVQKKETA